MNEDIQKEDESVDTIPSVDIKKKSILGWLARRGGLRWWYGSTDICSFTSSIVWGTLKTFAWTAIFIFLLFCEFRFIYDVFWGTLKDDVFAFIGSAELGAALFVLALIGVAHACEWLSERLSWKKKKKPGAIKSMWTSFKKKTCIKVNLT